MSTCHTVNKNCQPGHSSIVPANLPPTAASNSNSWWCCPAGSKRSCEGDRNWQACLCVRMRRMQKSEDYAGGTHSTLHIYLFTVFLCHPIMKVPWAACGETTTTTMKFANKAMKAMPD